ncbi:MAG: PHP domain-containing protein [Halioglobus sp.]|nr:PHP domain-containing protein [Halioglobus sp.]
MRIDFHTHTTASDGALAPAELVARALAGDVQLLAITDHDTMLGSAAAARLYTHGAARMRLIPGVEFSCVWSGTTVHILGLGVDAAHPAMVGGLAQLVQAREARGQKISSRLEACGFGGALAGALCEAGESQLGRPHFARWLVAQGHVRDETEAFDKYLGQGRTGDVRAFWPQLAEVVRWIVAAGGVAVIAHPLQYRFTRLKLRRLVVDFVAAGGGCLEVLSGRQNADQVGRLAALAREFDLEVSVGSDFHRDSPYGPQVGVELPRLEGLRGVWERWMTAA